MTMSMYKIFCVTNRRLVEGNFSGQLERIAKAGVSGIILREKDLRQPEYENLAEQARAVCGPYGTPLILHTFTDVARRLGIRRMHLPYPVFDAMEPGDRVWFDQIGVSVHSLQEARNAEQTGASYLSAGHIYETDCKKDLPPRGLSFLAEVCRSVSIPVYAIGGIHPQNAKSCIEAGAEGVCLMSPLMRTKDPEKYLEEFTD